MVVVAEGAKFAGGSTAQGQGDTSGPQSGQAAERTAKTLQSLIAGEFYPLVIGPWQGAGIPQP